MYKKLAQLEDSFNEQELSYRKQIARQLRTQYVLSIYIGLITRDLEI